ARKLMFDLRAKLGAATDYPARVTAAEEDAKKLAASLTDLTGKIKRMEDFSKDHIKRQDTFYQDVTGRIDKENKDILNQVRINTEAFKKLTESNQSLTAELDEKKGEILKLKD